VKRDANDILRQHGADELRDSIDKAPPKKVRTKETAARFALVHIDDIEPGDEPLWLLDEILPAGPALAVVFGAPKSRKTFFVADMLYHAPMGRDYCGRAIRQGAVVYITTEGKRGFEIRMQTMREHYGVVGAPFYAITDSMPNLGTKPGDAEALVRAIKAALPQGVSVAAVAVDTLVRAMPGQSDSDGRDMGVFVDNCDYIAQALQCLIVVIHHSPRSDATRTRGSNVLDGAADALISVVANGATSTVTVEALKDGEPGLTWRFRVVLIEVTNRNQKHGFAPSAKPSGSRPGSVTAKPRRNQI
jgi:hypothetical protein